MGGKGKAPPPPDYSQIAAANKEAAEVAAAVSREQLEWAKTQYAQDRADNKAITDTYLPLVAQTVESAIKDRARYENIYQPLEDKLAQEAADYATEERKQQEVGRAVADVDTQFEQARNAAQANLTSYGLDPGQVRAGALDLGSRLQEAAAKAGSADLARQRVDNIGRALRSEAINIGRGYPGQVAQSTATAAGTGTQAAQTNLATTGSGAATMGTGVQWAGIQNQALGNWGDYSARVHQANMQYNASQQGMNPLSIVGGIAGRALGGWASGGFAKKGGEVKTALSPSRGAEDDDVMLNVSAGEYVLPKDVVARKGTEFFDKLVEKARGGKGPKPAITPRGQARDDDIMDDATLEKAVLALFTPPSRQAGVRT